MLLQCGLAKARRLHDKLVVKFGLSLNIPVSEYVHSEGPATATLPYQKPTDLFRVLLRRYPWLFFGGVCETAARRTMLETFWATYKQEHPEHEVFQNPERLGMTFPITLHGDGGRTQKKQPLEILSLQPVLGLDTAGASKKHQCHCRCETSVAYGGGLRGRLGNPASQRLNSKHSTYLTHFLVFAFPSKSYSLFSDILTGLLTTVMDDLALACQQGITVDSGETFYPACVGFKLDMEWMAKVGSLTRSYQNVGHVNQKPCCHECDAGQAGVAFEDVNKQAAWVSTRYNTVPWVGAAPWSSVPFDKEKPAKFLRRDAFHVFRLGICRNFLASCIFLLINIGCFLFLLSTMFFKCFASLGLPVSGFFEW